MQKVVLPNGLTVIYQQKKGKAVVVEVLVKVGSNNESPAERGISHFLEHILFEGTKNRSSNREISNEIESIGGDFNAYTTNERTCFHVKVLQKHFPKAVEVLADILQNSLLRKEDIEKEKRVVLKEIDMVNDEPRFYQWILLQRHLFQNHPCQYPTYGSREVIRNLTREKIVHYFEKYYFPKNMVITIVGEVPSWKEEIKKQFTFRSKKEKKISLKPALTTILQKSMVKKEQRKVVNTYIIMGFRTVPAIHPDAAALEVINGIVGRGQSGRMFAEIRGKRGLAYDVGTQNVAESSFGYFAIYASINRKNVTTVKSLIMQELDKLSRVSQADLREAIEYIEGNFYLGTEDAQKLADQILFWEQMENAALLDTFIARIKKVTISDIKRVVKKYFNRHVFVILEGK